MIKDCSDNKRLSFLKYAIEEQFQKYKRVTALCLEQTSDKSLKEIKLYDSIFVDKISKVLSEISKNLGPELAPPPSPEELAAFEETLKVQSEHEGEAAQYTTDNSHDKYCTTNKEKARSIKSMSIKSKSGKSSSFSKSSSTSANERRMQAQVEVEVAILKHQQAIEMKRLKQQKLEVIQEAQRQQQELELEENIIESQNEIDSKRLEARLWEEQMVQQQLGNEYEPDHFDVTQVNGEPKNTPEITSRIESWITNPTPYARAPKPSIANTQVYTYNKAQPSRNQAPEINPLGLTFIPGLQVTETQAFTPITSIEAPVISLPQKPKIFSSTFNMETYRPSYEDQVAEQLNYQAPQQYLPPLESISKALIQSQLPRQEIAEFDGNPKKYQSFIQSFKTNIASKIQDNSSKLTYLLQYCRGKAHDLIDDCIMLPPKIGYETAINRLQERFGAPYRIADSFVESLLNGPVVKPNDVEGLVNFADELVKCQSILGQLQFQSNLDSTDTLKQVAHRMPNYLYAKWVDVAADILANNKQPRFFDLVNFIKARARVASTLFGRDYATQAKFKVHKGNVSGDKVKGIHKRTMMATQVDTSSKNDKFKSNQSSKPSAKSTSYPNTEPLQPSRHNSSINTGDKSSYKSNHGTSHNTARKSTEGYCYHCEMCNHNTEDCGRLKKKPLEERLNFVKSTQLCFRCLKEGHYSKDCDAVCKICSRRHNILLHDESRQVSRQVKTEVPRGEPDDVSANATTSQFDTAHTVDKVAMPVVPVKIHGNNGDIETYAFIDPGCDISLIRRDLYDKLELEGTLASYTMKTLNASERTNSQFKTTLSLFSLDNETHVKAPAVTVDKIPLQLYAMISEDDISKWKHLEGIELPRTKSTQIGLIIGSNVSEAAWTLDERRGHPGEPTGRLTVFGWTIVGPCKHNDSTEFQANWITVDHLQDKLKMQWEFDFQDFQENKEMMSKEDHEALQKMESSCKMKGGKYHLGIPWKEKPETLPDNRKQVEVRMSQLKKRLEKDPKLHEQYCETVEKYITDSHARKMTADEAAKPGWYLPHHPVFKKSNPNKCRVVFDCAAKYQGISLNDMILQGPNYLNNLNGVLTRFRREPIALMADVEAMFHQCFVLPEDQQYLRFLWWPKGDITQPPATHCMKVHLFGATSSPSIANYCIKRTAEQNKENSSAEAIDSILRSLYMDDLLKSVSTTEQAIQLVHEVSELLAKGGFRLTKWLSNDREVLNTIPEQERGKSLYHVNILEEQLPKELTLGLQWNPEQDAFVFDITLPNKPLTRRGLLSMTASLYDPLGFVCPVTLIPKKIQQQLCKMELDWDECIPEKMAEEVMKWKNNLEELSKLEIPRCFKAATEQNKNSKSSKPSREMKVESKAKTELHIFCDASEFAYGAVAYLKVYNENFGKVSFIMGKSRVAPIKMITIPRLELTAAVVAAKMYQFVKDEIDMTIDQVIFWTDSQVVLRYLHNTSSRFKVFVANRIQTIQEISNVQDWHYVPTNLNPADLASRGIQPYETEKLRFWLQGLDFLQRTDCPKFGQPRQEENDDIEVKRVMACEVKEHNFTYMLNYFSSYHKLQRSVIWWMRFIKYLKTCREKKRPTNESITTKEQEEADTRIIQGIQQEEFPEEVKAIKIGLPVKMSSKLASLCPIYENGLLKVGGRQPSRHPVILPRHHVTDLLGKSVHERNGHVGIATVLSRKLYNLAINARGSTKGLCNNKWLHCQLRESTNTSHL